MKIIIEELHEGEEEEIIIRSNNIDESILQMIYGVKMEHKKIVGNKDGKMTLIDPKDIYYFESVDNKTFIYCMKEVYESKLKLYEIEEKYENTDYIRISKSSIVNLNKIKSIRPDFGGKILATMENNENRLQLFHKNNRTKT